MLKITKISLAALIAVSLAACAGSSEDSPGPTSVAVFNTIPAALPPHLPSQPFQAQQTNEFGDYIQLAPGTGRHVDKATVVMDTWSTTAYSHPITLNLYSGTPGNLTLIGSKTQTFEIPARPAGSPDCPDDGYGAGFSWKNPSDGKCYHGRAFTITFDVSNITTALPDSLAYGIAYNTDTYGYAPMGSPGPYDSLNVGLIGNGADAASTTPRVGADPDAGALLRNFWNFSGSPSPGFTGFEPESDWTGYAPAVEFFAH
jgi:hypothetical protein